MKHICRLIALLLIFIFLTECKKGEGDPSVSLRTRAARLEGEWRLESGGASYTTEGYNETYVFDGTNVTITTTLYYPSKTRYVLSLKIKKDGTFTFKEIITGSILEASGTWNFNSGVGESKKKEEVVFFINKVQQGYTSNNIFNRQSTSFVYKIKELRNKKLVIGSTGKLATFENGKYATLSTDYNFIQ